MIGVSYQLQEKVVLRGRETWRDVKGVSNLAEPATVVGEIGRLRESNPGREYRLLRVSVEIADESGMLCVATARMAAWAGLWADASRPKQELGGLP